MLLSDDELKTLLRLVCLTREHEIDCEQCRARIAEFSEYESLGRRSCGVADAVRQHLAVCGECQEEYRLLQQALKALDSAVS